MSVAAMMRRVSAASRMVASACGLAVRKASTSTGAEGVVMASSVGLRVGISAAQCGTDASGTASCVRL
jgi:hypothetical protein